MGASMIPETIKSTVTSCRSTAETVILAQTTSFTFA